MTALLKRVHIWVGLFNLTALIVFATTGLVASVPHLQAPDDPPPLVVPYEPPVDATDRDVAADLFRRLALPLTGPVPDWAIGRSASNVLVLSFNSVNGVYDVTVDEPGKRVLVRHARRSLGDFLAAAHATTLYGSAPDLRVRLWAAYVDLSIVSLLFLSATGVWLWLTSRPRLWWAWLAFAGGSGLFVVAWIAAR